MSVRPGTLSRWSTQRDASQIQCAQQSIESDAVPKLLSQPPERGTTIGIGSVKYHVVSPALHKLSNGFLTNSNAPRDLTVGMSLEIEILDQLPVRDRHSRTSRKTGGPG